MERGRRGALSATKRSGPTLPATYLSCPGLPPGERHLAAQPCPLLPAGERRLTGWPCPIPACPRHATPPPPCPFIPRDAHHMPSLCASDFPTKSPGGTAPSALRHLSAALPSSLPPNTKEHHFPCKPCSPNRCEANIRVLDKTEKPASASVPRTHVEETQFLYPLQPCTWAGLTNIYIRYDRIIVQMIIIINVRLFQDCAA